MHKSRIIGVSGRAGSGKDTVAEHLIAEYGFVRIALADPIKRFGYHVFLFTEKQLWGPSQYRNAVDARYAPDSAAWAEARGRLEAWGREYCRSVMGTDDVDLVESAYKALVHWFCTLQESYPNLSPRVMLQTLGTEWGREAVRDSIWIDALLSQAKTLLHEDGNTKKWTYDPLLGPIPATKASKVVHGVVISDVRFQNEFEAIHKEGGSVIRVIRPSTDSEAASIGIFGHASEAEDFDLDSFDCLIQNDHSLRELYQAVDTYIELFNLSHH